MPALVEFLNPNVLNLLDRDLSKLGRDFSKRGGLRQPIERSVRDVLIPSITENFLAGGRPDAWEPLDPQTIMRRTGTSRAGFLSQMESLTGGTAPLMRTRKLFNAAKALARWVIRENRATYDFSTFPEKAWYGVVHDQPPIAERAGIPARPFALIQEKDIEDITQIFWDWIQDRIQLRTRPVYR